MDGSGEISWNKYQPVKDCISRLNKFAFNDLFFILLRNEYGAETVQKLPDIGEGIYSRKIANPYAEASIAQYMPNPVFDGVYILDSSPLDLFKSVKDIPVNTQSLLDSIRKVKKAYSNRVVALDPYNDIYPDRLLVLHIINNLAGFTDEERNSLLREYEQLIENMFLPCKWVDYGCPDTFDPDKSNDALQELIDKYQEGICLIIDTEKVTVGNYSFDKYLLSGVSHESRTPVEPVYFRKLTRSKSCLAEFEHLINSNPKEKVLEEFLRNNYKEVFGPVYDRIETQLLLRFPELDISDKGRRTDVFLRNSLSHDWELYEIKRVIKLDRSYRDIPVVVSEVLYAIQQIKNYARILNQDRVRRHFEKEGIAYYEPVLNLVVGRRPQLDSRQWRRLVADNTHDVKILTYDDLLDEMRIRLLSKLQLLK